MASNYQRKTNHQSWSEESMHFAIQEMINGNMGDFTASKAYLVPQITLENRVKKGKSGATISDASKKGSLGSRKPVFSSGQEQELVEYALLMENRFFGLTLRELRSLVFELAERNNLPHNFNRGKQMAGKCWQYSFLKRYPDLRLRSPEATFRARAMGFDRAVVNNFFDLLERSFAKYQFSPDRIYNVDETGVTTVPKKQSKVLALRGKRKVVSVVSEERGTLVTAETCMRTAGNYMLIMFVFPRKKANQELLEGIPPGTSAKYHESGWMQKDIFLKWFKRFINFAKPTERHPVLLLLDGRATHTKSLELIS
ncbi:uncharacterized protein LOC130450573 [Diorhabda sublineata]|uniref:uncharacterized protein LOC130450573 n=1 Tax=Diorhabda sublineata TaxID=1163346 RepID=UPI0024E12ACA|nr:uncharacterized protein LOC130450573 [Diorhabda sublineata]